MSGQPQGSSLLERCSRLDCDGVDLVRFHRVAVPLRSPLRASHGTEAVRHSTLVEVRDASGAAGWGECPALTHPTYTSEYAAGAWRVLCDELGPAALAGRAASIRGHAMARFALDSALADLRLRLAGLTLADALAAAAAAAMAAVPLGDDAGAGSPARNAGRRRSVGRTVVVGRRIDVESTRTSAGRGIDEVVADSVAAAASGARLVKVKIEPGWDRAPLAALRAALPAVPLAADANGAYAGCGPAALDWVGPLGLAYLEQPLDPDDLVGHAHLQARLATTPLALDESVGSPGLLEAAVALGAGRRFSLKPSRLGGLLAPARAAATTAGCFVGGMFELGVGRAAALALASLDVIELPSDLGPSDRYVEEDVTEPLLLDRRGDLIVPDGPGIGVDVRPERVAAVASEVAELRP